MRSIQRAFVAGVLVSAFVAWSGSAGTARADGPPPKPIPVPPKPPPLPAPKQIGGTAPLAPPPAANAGAGQPNCAPPAPPAAPKEVPPIAFPETGRICRRGEKGDVTDIYFYRTNFVSPDDLVKTVDTLLKLPGVTLKAFPRPGPPPPGSPQGTPQMPGQNEVLIEGTRDAIEAAIEALAYFDVAAPQVYVEAKIIEFSTDSNSEFGLSVLSDRDKVGPESFFRGGSANLNPPSFFQSQLPGNLPFQGIGLSFGFVGHDAAKYGALDLTLQALERNGNAEILSRPSIVATQGVEASVSTGQDIPVFQITNANTGPGGTTLVLTPSSTPTLIGLKVTATLIGDSFVTLKVDPEVSGVTGFSTSQAGASAPIISRRKASTTVTMADQDTLVIGGLITKSTTSDKAKIPLLSDIPLLGKLFTRTKDVETKTELTFWITPHILRKRSDFKVVVPPGERERLEREHNLCPATPASGSSSAP